MKRPSRSCISDSDLFLRDVIADLIKLFSPQTTGSVHYRSGDGRGKLGESKEGWDATGEAQN